MKVLLLMTWENPKSEERLKKYYEYGAETREYREERRKKYNVKSSTWADGTGKLYYMLEFENYEVYAKFMDDEELQMIWIKSFRTVDNAEMKVLRGAIQAPP